MKENEIPGCACTACGYEFDAATGIGQARNTEVDNNSLSLCIRCGNIDAFVVDDEGIHIRPLTAEEWQEASSQPTVNRAIAAVQRASQAVGRSAFRRMRRP